MIHEQPEFDIQQAADAIAAYANMAQDYAEDDVFDCILTLEESRDLEKLLEAGLDWSQAVLLINMGNHLYDNAEMIERMAGNGRLFRHVFGEG